LAFVASAAPDWEPRFSSHDWNVDTGAVRSKRGDAGALILSGGTIFGLGREAIQNNTDYTD
jgi:hypothetical protein